MAKILKTFLFLIPIFLNADFVVKSYQQIRNTNVTRQQYEESCGASALATLINLMDSKNISEFEILKKMQDNNEIINTNMVSFQKLKQVANKLGYEAQGYQFDIDLFNKLNIPAIVKIQNDPRYPHFVVVINHSKDFLNIFDPSFGEYLSLKSDFFKLWDNNNKGGYALVLAFNKTNFDYKPIFSSSKAMFDKF